MTDELKPPKKKKSKPKSPTQRTLELCRKHGWTIQVVERWNQFAHVRIDLFGFIDLIAVDGKSIIAIQSTVGGEMARRIHKIKAEPRSLEWVKSGGRLFVHGWRKLVSSGRWECRELEITVAMLESHAEMTAEMANELSGQIKFNESKTT